MDHLQDLTKYAEALAATLEESEETVLGPTDSELCAKALRLLAALSDTFANKGVFPTIEIA
jgi:hypothetical protein